MTKEKETNLIKYMDDLINKLNSPVPDKHKDHPNQYKQFLEHEIAMVKNTIEKAKNL